MESLVDRVGTKSFDQHGKGHSAAFETKRVGLQLGELRPEVGDQHLIRTTNPSNNDSELKTQGHWGPNELKARGDGFDFAVFTTCYVEGRKYEEVMRYGFLEDGD